MNPRFHRKNCKPNPGVSLAKRLKEPIGVSSVSAKNTMFDIIQGKSMTSNLIGEPVKKARNG
jgi:hypothetical protein